MIELTAVWIDQNNSELRRYMGRADDLGTARAMEDALRRALTYGVDPLPDFWDYTPVASSVSHCPFLHGEAR